MSKFSIVAFTDTLRREMERSGINVSLIEPGCYKTKFTDPQKLVQQMYQNWNQCSVEVKESYGDPIHETKFLLGILDLIPPITEMDKVIEDMIDSVVNRYPRALYRSYGFSYKVINFLDMFFPALLDQILYLLENIIHSD